MRRRANGSGAEGAPSVVLDRFGMQAKRLSSILAARGLCGCATSGRWAQCAGVARVRRRAGVARTAPHGMAATAARRDARAVGWVGEGMGGVRRGAARGGAVGRGAARCGAVRRRAACGVEREGEHERVWAGGWFAREGGCGGEARGCARRGWLPERRSSGCGSRVVGCGGCLRASGAARESAAACWR